MVVWERRVRGEGQGEGVTKEQKETFGGDEYFECGDAFTSTHPSQNFSNCVLCICGVYHVSDASTKL